MKDYSSYLADSKRYVLSYKVENNEIIVKTANDKVFKIPYSEENERIVLDKMENQAKRALPLNIGYNDILFAVVEPLVLPMAISNFVNNGGVLNFVILSSITAGTLYFPIKIARSVIEKHDIKKMHYFLENKDEINMNLNDVEELDIKLLKKTANKNDSQKDSDIKQLNINDIDNYSLSELKHLKKLLELIANDERVKESALVLERKPNPKK